MGVSLSGGIFTVGEGESSGLRTLGLAPFWDLDPGFLNLSFLICQVRLIGISTWQGFCENETRQRTKAGAWHMLAVMSPSAAE